MLHRRLIAPVLVVLLVGACGPSEPATRQPTGDLTATASPGASAGVVATDAPSSGPPGSDGPAVTPPAAESASPDATAPAEASPVATPSTAPDAGAGCTGTAANREFFVGVAEAVRWPVFCAVLPKGWFVNTGRYRLANGGYMVISYKGPGGATLALSEGSFCKQSNGCVPPGTDAGEAAFGRLDGTLVQLDDGGVAVVVNRGDTPSWLFEAHGLDEAASVSLAGELLEVGG